MPLGEPWWVYVLRIETWSNKLIFRNSNASVIEIILCCIMLISTAKHATTPLTSYHWLDCTWSMSSQTDCGIRTTKLTCMYLVVENPSPLLIFGIKSATCIAKRHSGHNHLTMWACMSIIQLTCASSDHNYNLVCPSKPWPWTARCVTSVKRSELNSGSPPSFWWVLCSIAFSAMKHLNPN